MRGQKRRSDWRIESGNLIPIRCAIQDCVSKIAKFKIGLPFPPLARKNPPPSRMVKKYLSSYSHLLLVTAPKREKDEPTAFLDLRPVFPLFLPWTLDLDPISSSLLWLRSTRLFVLFPKWTCAESGIPVQVTYYACISLVVVLFCVFLDPPPFPRFLR